LVGTDGADGGPGATSGCAYYFVRNAGVWTEHTKLTAFDAAVDDYFGESLSLDGDSILVGSPFNDAGGVYDSGAVYAIYGIGLIFMDGFESGDLSEWSSHVP
jgi:hypothetical protein